MKQLDTVRAGLPAGAKGASVACDVIEARLIMLEAAVLTAAMYIEGATRSTDDVTRKEIAKSLRELVAP